MRVGGVRKTSARIGLAIGRSSATAPVLVEWKENERPDRPRGRP
jgi:hypothetical protein